MNGSNGLECSDEDHARSRKTRARAVRALLLAAVFAVAAPAYAQGCAGGSGGGLDATGNECNESAILALPATHVAAPAPRPVAGAGKIRPTKATLVSAAPSAKVSGATGAPKLAARGAERIVNAAPPRVAAAQVSNSESGISTPCSGGSYGGMDMTGNQCGDYPEADGNLRLVYASRR